MKTATALAVLLLAAGSFDAAAGSLPFAPPASPRATYNFNPAWKFIRQDVPGAENPDFDDSAWVAVSLPHTYNDVDSFQAHHQPQRRGPERLRGPRLVSQAFQAAGRREGRESLPGV